MAFNTRSLEVSISIHLFYLLPNASIGSGASPKKLRLSTIDAKNEELRLKSLVELLGLVYDFGQAHQLLPVVVVTGGNIEFIKEVDCLGFVRF